MVTPIVIPGSVSMVNRGTASSTVRTGIELPSRPLGKASQDAVLQRVPHAHGRVVPVFAVPGNVAVVLVDQFRGLGGGELWKRHEIIGARFAGPAAKRFGVFRL